MRAINLLPRDDNRRNQKTQWIVLVPVAAAVLLTALLSVTFLSASGKVKDKQSELQSLNDTLAAIPTPDASKIQSQNALATDKQVRVTALSAALTRRVAWDRIFRELSLVLPDDVWLSTLSARAPVSSSVRSPRRPPPRARRSRPRSSRSTGSRTLTRRSRDC